MNDILILLVSFCFAELVHNTIEIWGIRQKVRWLDLSLQGKEHGHWPIHINTKTKTVVLHVLILLITGGLGFVILNSVNLPKRNLVILGVVTLLINYIITIWKVDKFHTEIGRLIRNAKNKK